MIIRSFGDEGSGFDPRNYTPFGSCERSVIKYFSANYYVDTDITGEGFLSHVIFSNAPNNTFLASLKITIDGTVVVNSAGVTIKNTTNVNGVGLFVLGNNPITASHIEFIGKDNSTAYDLTTKPYTMPIVVLPEPLFFYNSCKIELKVQAAPSGSPEAVYDKLILGGLLT